jgi:hypothetical protein
MNGVAQPPFTGPQLTLLGPGAVTGLSRSAIVRTDPTNGAHGVEENYLVQVELARPDLPWMFSPACPNNQSRLRPWIVLIVVDSSTVEIQPGTPLPRITVNDSVLPDLNDSWAWVHVQATVNDGESANDVLAPASGGSAVSRLLCPRRLATDTSYLACIVPSTLIGVEAGLGLPLDPGPAIAPAWTAGAGQSVTLPIYHSWRFSTGAAGDFKSLVLRLTGITPTELQGFGVRSVDVAAPWQTPPQIGGAATIQMDGAFGIGIDFPLDQAFTDAFQPRLTKLLNFPADRNPTIATADPSVPGADPTLSAVAPPIYGGRHAGIDRVPDTAGWLQTLNVDPRRRIAAAFGTRYVQENQEFLMALAWNQLGAVEEGNRLQALAELMSEVADRMHARHFKNLSTSELFSIAAPARTRVKLGGTQTLQASATTTQVPDGAVSVAFRRVARPQGPLGRRAFDRANTQVIQKGLSNTLVAAPPALRLDGIRTLMNPPAPLSGVTGGTILRSWGEIKTVEQSIPPPGDLSALRHGADGKTQGLKGIGLDSGLPILLKLRLPPVALPVQSVTETLVGELLPSSGISRRFVARVKIPPRFGVSGAARRVMAYPVFSAPLALALLAKHKEWLLPGLGNFPDDKVTILFTNPQWIESFLAGVNHEMNRELLWRGFPTDRLGTPFQYFWPRPDRKPDIPPMTQWDISTTLGANGAANGPDPENMVVLLVRGEVLHRYPNTIAYAAHGAIDKALNRLTLDNTQPWIGPQFLIKLDSKTTVFAYPINPDSIRSDVPNGNAGFYFVFTEPETGPRFRFALTQTVPLQNWSDLDWGSVPQASGFAVAGLPFPQPTNETADGRPRWNRDAADTGRIAYARPFRIAYHADELLAKADEPAMV